VKNKGLRRELGLVWNLPLVETLDKQVAIRKNTLKAMQLAGCHSVLIGLVSLMSFLFCEGPLNGKTDPLNLSAQASTAKTELYLVASFKGQTCFNQ